LLFSSVELVPDAVWLLLREALLGSVELEHYYVWSFCHV
jgi:hypothetical protein